MKAEVEVKVNNFGKLINALTFLRDNSVYVGTQQKKSTREGDEITNAELLFIHTFGSPLRGIPARPSIEPAIEDDEERLTRMFKKSAQAILGGNPQQALDQLKLIGMRGQNISRGWFVNPKNGWPPNSPSTIRAKMAKFKGKGVYEPRPLIDTGQLRKSITYFVEHNGERIE